MKHRHSALALLFASVIAPIAPRAQPSPGPLFRGAMRAPVPSAAPVENLVANGGFEASQVRAGTFQQTPRIPGWTMTRGGAIEVQTGVAGAACEGRALVELAAEDPTSIAQDLSTRPGMSYQLRLAFSARPGTGLAESRVGVYWDGRLVGRLEADGSDHDNTEWTLASFYVTARSARTRLELRDEGTANSVAAYIDDVRVTPATP